MSTNNSNFANSSTDLLPILPANFNILKQFSKGSNRVFLVETKGKKLIFKEIDKNKKEREFQTLRILEKYLTEKFLETEAQTLEKLEKLETQNLENSFENKIKNKAENQNLQIPRAYEMLENGLLLTQIQGKMVDDNLDLEHLEILKNSENQMEKQNKISNKADKTITDSLKLLKQIHEISLQIADKMGFENKIRILQIDQINPEIQRKLEKIKTKNPEIGKVLTENWQKYGNNSNLETKITQKTTNLSLCHGDFGLEHIYFETEKNLENSENDLKFTGIIDFGDAIYADFYLDIAHFLLKDADKNFGKTLAKLILESYFETSSELKSQNQEAENQTINFVTLGKFGTFWAINRLFENLENEILFGKFVSKYLAFLEILAELKMEMKMENSQSLELGN